MPVCYCTGACQTLHGCNCFAGDLSQMDPHEIARSSVAYPQQPSAKIWADTGWRCPACGKGNAPWQPTCGHCAEGR